MDAVTSAGCTWVVGYSRRWDIKKRGWQRVSLHCNKLPAENDTFCPKHRLFAQELGEQQQPKKKPHLIEQMRHTTGKR